jgi:AcrR family transcriptional regulator
MTRGESTRARILDAAMPLFAERGYQGTTVGDIEQAAGLAPRSGALYQHFEGKEEVLRACVERQVEELDRMQTAVEMLPLGDLRAELTLIGRWNLADLKRRQPLYRFLWKEGERFPDLRDAVGHALTERPLRRVAQWLRTQSAEAGLPEPDGEALALVIVQSMASYRGLETLYGRPPLDVDEERFLAAWVDMCVALVEQSTKAREESTA